MARRAVRNTTKDPPELTSLAQLDLTQWHAAATPAQRDRALSVLEGGGVLWLPDLPFRMEAHEGRLLSPELAAAISSKNLSLSPDGQALRGFDGADTDRQLLQGMMWRFATAARTLVGHLLPASGVAVRPGRTSFRPAEIAGRVTSWRKDDTRLHVDSFPSSPTAGWRILRVFSNVNPQQAPRTWRLGEPFEQVARRFVPAMRGPLWGTHALMHALGITKQRRTDYDHYMLGLHDAMKADLAYQASAEQRVHDFAAGTSWLVYTDQASHAATRGSHALEQTFLVPVQAMREQRRSPLRVLESMLGRSLV